MLWMQHKKTGMPSVGRSEPMTVVATLFVNGRSIKPPFPDGMQQAMFGLGCFWGAERRFWEAEGVYVTAVGYPGGCTPNPSYDEVCSGMTGHNEATLVVFDPQQVSYARLLVVFGESYNPTQGYAPGKRHWYPVPQWHRHALG